MVRLRAAALVAGLMMFGAGPSLAATALPPIAAAPDLAPQTVVRPFALTRVTARIPRGAQWGVLKGGLLCVPHEKLIWQGGAMKVDMAAFDTVFREEMQKVGFKVAGDPQDLFSDGPANTDYAVAGAISRIDAQPCFPNSGFGDLVSISGSIIMDVEWTVYSRLRREVVAKITTSGGYQQGRSAPGAFDLMLNSAFAANVQNLTAADAFRSVVLSSPQQATAPGAAATPDAEILLKGSLSAKGRPLSESVGSVVTILTGSAMGSGYLVSTEGHILTNRHVVGDARQVKVRWSDGFEAMGDVLRSHAQRDVAIILSRPHGREPLALRTKPAQLGEVVFAIGTPLDPKLQNTITKGIVSAKRTEDGFAFIQSDAATNHGNSGGPLLDEKGQVIGMAVAGMMVNDAQVGLNLFIPISDALDFLNLKPAP